MSTLREAAQAVVDRWASDESVQFVSRSDGQRTTATVSKNALLLLAECAMRAELAKPDARPAPAEPQPIAAWSIVRTAESAVVTAVRAALSAAPAPQPAGGEPQPAAQQEQAGERKPLTDEPIEAAEWERECDDTDTILRALGLDPARCRTDGGSLKVQMIVGALAKPAAAPEGWQLVPVEPTEAMWSAGRDPVMFRELKHYRPASLPVPAWQRNPDGTVEKDTSKGTTAVHVWRAMLAAAPGAPTAPAPTSATVSEPDCHGRTGVDDGHRACGRDWSG